MRLCGRQDVLDSSRFCYLHYGIYSYRHCKRRCSRSGCPQLFCFCYVAITLLHRNYIRCLVKNSAREHDEVHAFFMRCVTLSSVRDWQTHVQSLARSSNKKQRWSTRPKGCRKFANLPPQAAATCRKPVIGGSQQKEQSSQERNPQNETRATNLIYSSVPGAFFLAVCSASTFPHPCPNQSLAPLWRLPT